MLRPQIRGVLICRGLEKSLNEISGGGLEVRANCVPTSTNTKNPDKHH